MSNTPERGFKPGDIVMVRLPDRVYAHRTRVSKKLQSGYLCSSIEGIITEDRMTLVHKRGKFAEAEHKYKVAKERLNRAIEEQIRWESEMKNAEEQMREHAK